MNETHALIIAGLALIASPAFFVLGAWRALHNSANWHARWRDIKRTNEDLATQNAYLRLERDEYRRAYLEERTTCQLALAAVAELQEEIDLHMKAEATAQEFLSGSD